MNWKSWEIQLLELELFNLEAYSTVQFWGGGSFLLKCWVLSQQMVKQAYVRTSAEISVTKPRRQKGKMPLSRSFQLQ